MPGKRDAVNTKCRKPTPRTRYCTLPPSMTGVPCGQRVTSGCSSGRSGEIDLMPRNDVILTVLAFVLTMNALAVLVVARAHSS